jgi:hypothetical protein
MEITNISNIDSTQYLNQDYTPKDESLLNSLLLNKDFGLPEDKIEVHVISPTEGIIDSTYDFRNYKIVDTTDNSSLYHTIELDPKSDLESFGYFRGQYDINYNFYREIFSSSLASQFFISEISSDRTEIKISTNNVSYTSLGQSYLNYIAERNSRAFYSDFLLNFGENDTYIGVNIAFDNVNTSIPSLYIKLYEPLPSKLSLKDTLWLVEQISEPYSFQVNTEFVAEEVLDSTPLRGPNISIELNEKANLTTPYLNLSTLLSTSVTSSYQQLQSWLEENNVEITVDYTDFSNFVHFSSANERLENFKYKLSQIESLQSDINSLNNLNISSSINYTTTSKSSLQSRIDTIIQKFDGYEYFLYYESGSDSWPKLNSSKPYLNYSTTSSQAKTWFGSTTVSSTYYGGQILDAFNYDSNNKDYIWNNLPEYIKEDTQNSNLELFVAMLGQHYDYIWTYVKDITDLQVADNRVDFGISKDLVADTLRNFGIKLYTNSRNQDDIFSSLLGVNSAGGFLPSTGSLLITNYVTASQYTIPDNDIVKETYKRIYHNLPYLLKTKGTRRGLYSLINCFGIPETILKVKEYGGNKKDQDIIEQFNKKFNYSLKLNNTASLAIPFQPSYKQYLDTGFNDVYPDTFEFRFKFDNTSSVTQSLLQSQDNRLSIGITPSTSSYASLFFKVSGSGTNFITSSQIILPFYNKDWWNLNITKQSSSLSLFPSSSLNELISNYQARVIADGGTFELTPSLLDTLNLLLSSPDLTQNQYYNITVGNKDSNGIQYLTSSSLFITGTLTSSNAVFNSLNTFYLGGTTNYPFSGSVQEFRYWIDSIPTDDFKDHILNPQSIVYNGVTSSYNNLIFRLPLGSELDNTKTSSLSSVHPAPTASFISASITSSKAIINNYLSSSYKTNNETFLVNTPNVGSITEIDEKVRIADPNLVPGDVLTPYISIQKPETYPYTTDLNIVEVAISPQDSINEDIISQLGSFNIDEYIGDPGLAASGSYPALTELRNFYFQKYSKKENIFDIIKLLSYFDNSLFKMIKDFVPAKANLSTGLVIKPHILERNKTVRHEPVLEFNQYSGSIETAFISGSNGLDEVLNTDFTSFIPFTGDPYEYSVGDYSWAAISQNLLNPYGGTYKSHTDKRELFTGELGGTIITVHSQSQENIVYELNNLPVSSSQAINDNYYRLPVNPILNNVSLQQTSSKYLDIDYGTNNIIPTNNNFLRPQLLLNISSFDYPFLNSTVQNSNYTLYRHITPRYNGSKLTGTLYNTYTPGDISYGKDPVINSNSVKFAYFTEVTSQSLTLPERSNVNLKYLIDSASNVTELTEANNNLFDIQDIFNRTDANIVLENINQPSKQKSLNGLKPIYAGGFRYEPILQNYSDKGTGWSSIEFSFANEQSFTNPSSGSQVTASYNGGLVIKGSPTLNFFSYSPINRLNNTLGAYLSTNLLFPIERNIPQNNIEIRQRITGSLKITIKVSPPTNLQGTAWNEANTKSGSFSIPFPQTSANTIGTDNGWSWSAWDDIGYIKMPIGSTAYIYQCDNVNISNTFVGDGSTKNPIPIDCNGVDYITTIVNDTSASFTTSSIINNLQSTGNLVYLNTGSGTYPIENVDGLTIEATYPFEGELILPANKQTANVYLTNFSGTRGLLTTYFNFAKTSTSPQIQFTTAPTQIIGGPTNVGSSYYFTQAPSIIYVTSSYDNGFNSGSTGESNWYFERGNKIESGSTFTLLTASRDLSTLYYNLNIEGGEYYGNSATQVLPTHSLNLGYQDITEPFNPKVGDLIRLFNHDSNKFPYSTTFEREIINIYPPYDPNLIGTGSNGTGSYTGRLVFEVNTIPDNDSLTNIPAQSCINNPSSSAIGHLLNFMFLSKIPDETNIIINHDKRPGSSSAGMIIPENVSSNLRKEVGNIIKGLKSQNLI